MLHQITVQHQGFILCCEGTSLWVVGGIAFKPLFSSAMICIYVSHLGLHLLNIVINITSLWWSWGAGQRIYTELLVFLCVVFLCMSEIFAALYSLLNGCISCQSSLPELHALSCVLGSQESHVNECTALNVAFSLFNTTLIEQHPLTAVSHEQFG